MENFQREVVDALARIEEGQAHMVRRLDTLNGKVADHERRLNDSALAAAFAKGAKDANQTWLSNVSPAAKVVALIVLIEILRNGPTIAKALGR